MLNYTRSPTSQKPCARQKRIAVNGGFFFIFITMKPNVSLALFLALSVMFSQAQDSTQNKKVIIFKAIEKVPAYPGGAEAISRHITQNLKYPEVAKLIGINGRIVISFVIDKQGVVREVTPVNCIGAGCESEAVK